MKIPKRYSQQYVCCLPEPLETEIMHEVTKAVSTLSLTDTEKKQAIEDANNEKVCNLTDTISVEFV